LPWFQSFQDSLPPGLVSSIGEVSDLNRQKRHKIDRNIDSSRRQSAKPIRAAIGGPSAARLVPVCRNRVQR